MGDITINRIKTFYLVILTVMVYSCKKADKDITISEIWSANDDNPEISFDAHMESAFWADPDVLQDSNGLYQLYLTGNYEIDGIEKKAIYRATSDNSIDWNFNTNPVLLPSDSLGNLDFFSVSAPTVIILDNVMHMYYSQQENDTTSAVSIGHAFSIDNGENWLKDGTVILPSGVTGTYDEIQVNAPSAVIFNNKLYLYYGANSWREGVAYPSRQRTIALSISEDGFTFDSA